MSKFKSFKTYLNPIKCITLVKRALMASSNNTTGAKKKTTKAPRTSRNGSDPVAGTSSAEGFIPLAARDSQWADLSFYNPNFKTQLEDEESLEEELHVSDSSEKEPMYILFPGLSKDDSSILSTHSSTTEVTKMLVGQKADFSHMKSSRKLLPAEHKLTSVAEMPQEETSKCPSDRNIPALAPSSNHTHQNSRRSISGDDVTTADDVYDIDEDENDDSGTPRATHPKRRKRRSDMGRSPIRANIAGMTPSAVLLMADSSSQSVVATSGQDDGAAFVSALPPLACHRRKPSSRVRLPREESQTSSGGIMGDDERGDD